MRSRVCAALAAVVVTALTLVAGPPGVARAVDFNAVADTYTNSSKPTTNYGSASTLRFDGSPQLVTYLRFDLAGVANETTGTLRLFFETSASDGFAVHAVVDTTWDELAVTAANAPAVGNLIATVPSADAGSYVDIDVSAVIAGDGPLAFAVLTGDNTAVRMSSRTGANPPQLVVPTAPPPSNPSPFFVSFDGVSYHADSQVTPSAYTGSLKFVVESAVAELGGHGGGVVQFDAGTFDFGNDHLEFYDVFDITFAGAGIDVTVIQNNSSDATDTEPFDFTDSDRLVLRDFTVIAGGAPRNSSDALDFDNGDDILIERVKVTASRGRGIVFDGKDGPGSTADRNVVRDCVITGLPQDGIELLASGQNLIENCQISDVGGHGIQINKASASAGLPNKQANDNVVTGNFIDQAGRDGININSSSRNQIVGNSITNSSDDTSGRDGVRIDSFDGIGCDDNVVTNTVSTDDQPTKTQRFGVSITSPLCNRTVLSANALTGNLVGELLDLGTDTSTGAPPGVFGVVADAYVDADRATTNFGSSSIVRADATPVRRVYLRFDVSGLGGPVTGAVLRVYAASGSSVGHDVGVASSGWDESTLSWSNAPAPGASIGSSGPFNGGEWVEVDVTSAVSGDGTVTFVLSTPSSTQISYQSRENANPAELVVTTA